MLSASRPKMMSAVQIHALLSRAGKYTCGPNTITIDQDIIPTGILLILPGFFHTILRGRWCILQYNLCFFKSPICNLKSQIYNLPSVLCLSPCPMLHAPCLFSIHNPKLGARPKGGSPKDKSPICNLKSQIYNLPSVLCSLPSFFCRLPAASCISPCSMPNNMLTSSEWAVMLLFNRSRR